MRIRYFASTDTLLIEFRDAAVAETRDLDENTLLDVDAEGNICAITIEHASQRADIPKFSYEQIAA
jgi:uncharacterized protein YuzE